MDPADDPTSIGCILVNLGVITDHELKTAVAERQQVSPDELLGLFMVGKQVIDHDQLTHALEIQQKMRGNGKTHRALAAAEVASACVTKATATATRVHERIRNRHNGSNGANAAGK